MTHTPPEPFGPLVDSALRVHELYLSFISAGFNEPQALYLVGCIVTASMRPHQP